jgi:pimeloyl-ACP methyl ester carboxylesterase
MIESWFRKPKPGVTSTTIIFVHGVLSNSDDCWRHPDGGYWPQLIGEHPSLNDAGIYLFGYKTSKFSGSFNLDNVIDTLKEQLILDGVLNSGRLIFVCHSMGGIIARKYILLRKNDFIESGKEIGLFLVASPSLGSDYATWISFLAKRLGHSQADALRFSQSNLWLNDLNRQFRDMLDERQILLRGKELIEDRFVILSNFFRKQVVEPFSGAAYFGNSFKVPDSDHFSIAKPKDANAIQRRLLCKFIEDMDRTGVDLGAVQENWGEIRTTVNGCEIRVVNGRIEEFARTADCAIVLPCNEYFDDECADDRRSVLGAYVNHVFAGKVSEFKSLVTTEIRKRFQSEGSREKEEGIYVDSFGTGRCLLLSAPLGDQTPIALLSTTTQRAHKGLFAQVSFLFPGMNELFGRLADKRIREVAMPILGAGHGGIRAPHALVGLLLAIADAARYGQIAPERVTIVVFKKDAQSIPAVDNIIVRRTLALIASSKK